MTLPVNHQPQIILSFLLAVKLKLTYNHIVHLGVRTQMCPSDVEVRAHLWARCVRDCLLDLLRRVLLPPWTVFFLNSSSGLFYCKNSSFPLQTNSSFRCAYRRMSQWRLSMCTRFERDVSSGVLGLSATCLALFLFILVWTWSLFRIYWVPDFVLFRI